MYWVWKVLANTGTNGIKLVEDRIDYYENVAAHIETELIEKTGHDLMFTHIERINQRILEFLKK